MVIKKESPTKYRIEPGDWECATGESVDDDVVVIKVDQEGTTSPVQEAKNKMESLTDEERCEVMQCFCSECGCVLPTGRFCPCLEEE